MHRVAAQNGHNFTVSGMVVVSHPTIRAVGASSSNSSSEGIFFAAEIIGIVIGVALCLLVVCCVMSCMARRVSRARRIRADAQRKAITERDHGTDIELGEVVESKNPAANLEMCFEISKTNDLHTELDMCPNEEPMAHLEDMDAHMDSLQADEVVMRV